MANRLDLVDRDPNGINDHVKVHFEEVLAEPDTPHSIGCLWRNSYRCFNCSKKICYHLTTIPCGLCIALYWGCLFGCLGFEKVWCLTPAAVYYNIRCEALKMFFRSLTECFLGPCCRSFGEVFHHFGSPKKKKTLVEVIGEKNA